MKKRTTTVIAILMFLTGLSLLLYPTVSDYMKNLSYRRTISDYIEAVESMDDERYEELLEAARAFNERLAKSGKFMRVLSDEERAEYNSLLNVDGTGVMGYVSVPKVNISLPVYHGASDEVLQRGAGHLEGTSLPVGGPGTHSVLSAHTGLPSARMFTDIDQLEEGDTFTVQVLNEVLTYQVDWILVVLPDETEVLEIEPEGDYCTLVTCTPYGVNSHRLLVRGYRIPTPVQEEEALNTVEKILGLDDGRMLSLPAELVILPAAALLLAAVSAVLLLLWKRVWKQETRLKKKNEKPNQDSPKP